MNIIKKLIVVFIAFFTVSINAWAAEVAQIGDNKYESLTEAINAANDGDEILLLSDIGTNTVEVAQDKKISIDLNGLTLGSRLINNGTLTLKNGIMNNDGTNFFFNGVANMVTGTLSLENIEFVSYDGSTWCLINRGKATIKNSEFKSSTSVPQYIQNEETGDLTIESGKYVGFELFENSGKMTINGGEFESSNYSNASKNMGELVINNANFLCPDGSCIRNTRGTLTINNGYFKAEQVALNSDSDYSNETEEIKTIMYVNDGVFETTSTAFSDSSSFSKSLIIIKGGKITSNTTDSIISNHALKGSEVIILGGEIEAKNSGGIYTSTGKIVIGNKDNEVTNDFPIINISKGVIGSYKTLEFYDGKIITKELLDKKMTLIIPDGYYVKYDENEDKSLTAYLVSNTPNNDVDDKKEDESKVVDNNTTGNVSNENSKKTDNKDKKVDNPKTGFPIFPVMIIVLLLIITGGYQIIKRKIIIAKL